MNIITTIVATTALAVSASLVSATPTLSLTNPLTGDPSATVAPGGSFAINVALAPDEPFDGFSLYLQANAVGFAVTADTSDWSGPTGNPLAYPNYPINPADPPPEIPTTGNSHDFGFDSEFTSPNIAVGNYKISTLAVLVANTMSPGEYNISSTSDSEISNASQSVTDIHNIPAATYSVTVVPEPATLALLLAGSAALLMVKRRKRI
jgi:hypothetical protein